ncbi:MAG: adenosylmethionine decarboxylase [Zoogloeaceae bacterium]|jgi:spermidine synthase/S-adenosylmethionine decarboxylase|nr:adenosylmethionine decarboxylase [Zoogloeaceae bacterium]
MEGLHILAEFRTCKGNPALLKEAAALEKVCLNACHDAGLTVVGWLFHPFGTPEAPAGATGAVILAESHLTVHTWPELGAATLDLYVCNFSRDNRKAAETAYARLLQAFQPEHADRRDIWRGGMGNR